MGFVERIFNPVVKAVERVFTPPGTGGQEAAQQAAAATPAPLPQMPQAPLAPATPPSPPQFQPGTAPGASQRAKVTASTMLGAAATSGQLAGSTLGTGSSQKNKTLGA